MVKNRFFCNGGANLHTLHVKDTWDHFQTCLKVMIDPQNMDLDAFIFELSPILVEIWRITDLSVMAA